jgi:hypothetical protein
MMVPGSDAFSSVDSWQPQLKLMRRVELIVLVYFYSARACFSLKSCIQNIITQ